MHAGWLFVFSSILSQWLLLSSSVHGILLPACPTPGVYVKQTHGESFRRWDFTETPPETLPDLLGIPTRIKIKIGISAAATVLGSLALLYIFKRLNNWGSWRLHERSADGTRKKFVKTWHGWVDEQEALRREQKWTARKDSISRMCFPRTSKADWGWVFWDPDGSAQRKHQDSRDKTFLKCFPRWMRTDQRTVSQHAAQRASDLSEAERGLPRYLRPAASTRSFDQSLSGFLSTILRAPCRSCMPAIPEDSDSTTHQPSSTAVDPPDDRAGSTVRRRNSAHGSRAIWQSGSDEVNRAVQQQLSLPQIGPVSIQRTPLERPPQEMIFPFSPIENGVEIHRPVPMRFNQITRGAVDGNVDDDRGFDATAYEAAHTSDRAPSSDSSDPLSDSSFPYSDSSGPRSDSSVPSFPQREREIVAPPPSVPLDNGTGHQSSSGADTFFTPASHPDGINRYMPSSSTHGKQPIASGPSIPVNTNDMHSMAQANVAEINNSQHSSMGLGRFPLPPTRAPLHGEARSRSFEDPAEMRALGRLPIPPTRAPPRSEVRSGSLENPEEMHAVAVQQGIIANRQRSQSTTFRRLSPPHYVDNARRRSPSLLSIYARQASSWTSSSSSSSYSAGIMTSEEQDRAHALYRSNAILAESSSSDGQGHQWVFQGFSQPGPASIPAERVRESSPDDTGWITTRRPTLRGVTWEGFSDSG